MENIIKILKVGSNHMHRTSAQPRLGIVASTNPDTATVKVLLQPESVLTGWLPVATFWTGAGWGLWCPPTPGDQVLVIPQEGDPDSGVVVGALFSSSARPPHCDVGEIILTHKSGTSLSLLNSGVVSITGNLHVAGDIFDSEGSISRLRGNYDAHTHRDSQGGVTSVPTPQDQ
jgi:phage baseplate assembly protein gpV